EKRMRRQDLIEGNFARCGLVTDIELIDDFPSRYGVFVRREHRWIRGDWQILPWLFRRVPAGGTGERRRPNPLPFLERWKIFDHLRPGLLPVALLPLLALGWTVLPGSTWLWTGFALLVLSLPLALQLLGTLGGMLGGGSPWLYWHARRGDLTCTAGQTLLACVFLADQAWIALDAIAR